MYTCPTHPHLNEQDDYCPECVAAFENRKPISELTVEERLAEFENICDIVTMPFSNIHQRVEELCNRPVWTHEFIDPDGLRNEIISVASGDGTADPLEAMLSRIPEDKPVIGVVIQDS